MNGTVRNIYATMLGCQIKSIVKNNNHYCMEFYNLAGGIQYHCVDILSNHIESYIDYVRYI